MAVSVQGSLNANSRNLQGLQQADYDYADKYPRKATGGTVPLNLKPGSKLHDRLKNELVKRAQESGTFISARFGSWKNIDEVLTAYIKADDAEKLVKEKDSRRPISVVFPNTYAILETMLSYLSTAFFTDPIFRYVGVGPEDNIPATLLQYTIQQQLDRSKVILNLHTMWRDSLSYGVGTAHPYWKVQRGARPRIEETERTDPVTGEPLPKKRSIIYETNQVLSEGNALQNIDPYLMLPDPNVSIHNIQDGEYFGWVTHSNLMNLLTEEQTDEDMFNVRYLKHLGDARTTVIGTSNSGRSKTTSLTRSQTTSTSTTPVDVITMFVKLIPSEWKLGDGEYPEVWMFELAGDNVILKARPADYMHGMIPVAAAAPEFDGYSIAPISRLEVQYGLQGVLDWLFNSHIANVRKAMNDMLVVDPYLVNINDLKNPGPGKLIRMRRPAWGQGVQNAVQQLAVNDVTRGNMADASYIMSMMQNLSGSDSQAMGNLRQGGPERLTSAEFQGTRAGAVSRLQRVAWLISYQSMQDIGRMFAANTQQLMSRSTYIRSIGQWPEVLRKEFGTGEQIEVTPFDLIADFDVSVRDGSIPGGNFSDAWIQLYQILGSNPELSQNFDMVRIFKHIARNLGAKNVNEFERAKQPQVTMQPEIASDEAVRAEAQAGNLVNVGEL